MYQIYHIARQYLTTTYRSRTVLLFALAMPLVFTFVLGTIIAGGSPGGGEPLRWPIAVINHDTGGFGQRLIDQLQTRPDLNLLFLEPDAALRQIQEEDLVAILTIPPLFSEQLLHDGEAELALATSATQMMPGQSVQQAVQAAASQVSGVAQAAKTSVNAAIALEFFSAGSDEANAYFDQALGRADVLWASTLPLVIRTQPLTRLENGDQIPVGFQQSSPGMLVTFALVFMLNGAIVLILEREQGTLRRLLVMPMHKVGILSGKLLAVFVAGLGQAFVLIVAGQYLFGVNWGEAPLALVILVIAFTISITSLGMLIAGVAKTYAQANALASILMYSIAALGGAWWPVEITPQWMQNLAKITPTYWAMQGFHDIITRGLGVFAILPEATILLGFAVIFLSVGVWRFRYE